MVINHLLNGMILQVDTPLLHRFSGVFRRHGQHDSTFINADRPFLHSDRQEVFREAEKTRDRSMLATHAPENEP